MTTIYAIHDTDPDHLSEVQSEMGSRGAPAIEVVDCGDYFMALEGSHRLAAASALGLAPELIVREQDELLDLTRFDWFEPANWNDTKYPAGEVAGELFSTQSAVAYEFPE